MKKVIIPLILAVMIGLAFIGCKKQVAEGTLVIGTANFSYESMDPIYYESFWGFAMYDPLITFDAEGNYIGAVAKSWNLSPDGKTWTFKIRDDIKFHNGDPLTSEDVAFTVVRFSSKESTNPWSPYLRNNFKSVETPDPYTFVYHSVKPEPQLAVPFAWTRILPKNYIEKNGVDYFRKHPVGSGPWKFVEFISKTKMVMEANMDYWGQKPAFKKVVDLMIPEESTRVAMLKRGEIDIAAGLSLDRVVELKKEGWRTQELGLPSVSNLSFPGTWMTKGPTSDIRVRKAMSYAINRQEICDTFFKGLAKPGGRWFMEEHGWGWDPDWKADPYDPEKAKALLKEAGYPEKFSTPVVKMFAASGGIDPEFQQIIAGYWEAVGIQTRIEVVDPVTWGGMFFVRAKDASQPQVGAVFSWTFPAVFNNVYHCANMFKSTGVHSTGNDPNADMLYDKATQELDLKKAKQYWTEFHNYANGMYVNVGICIIKYPAIVSPKVGEFTTNAYMSIYDALAGIKHK